ATQQLRGDAEEAARLAAGAGAGYRCPAGAIERVPELQWGGLGHGQRDEPAARGGDPLGVGEAAADEPSRAIDAAPLGQPAAADAAYAERGAALVRLADEANRAVTDAQPVPRGLLRVTGDPVFGEAFLGPLIVDYARRWPEVRVEVALTRRRVDLVEEGFDVA